MKTLGTFAVALLLLLPSLALAEPKIVLDAKAEKDIVVKDEKGKETVKRVPASDIGPGETIVYSIAYRNEGTEPAVNVVLDNPIPAETTYIADSASGTGTEIVFSIDGGATFAKPEQLTYELPGADGKKEKVVATPDQYTHIRWTIKTVAPGGEGHVSFQVKVN